MSLWWRAIYDDGSVLEEVKGLSSELIDRARLKRFELRSGAVDVIAIEFDNPGEKRLVFRRRRDLADGQVVGLAHLVGWNSPDGLHIWRVGEDGQVVREQFPDIGLVPCEVF